MLFNAALILSFTLLAVASPASPQEKRATAKVITKCTVPNTVALTFVSGVVTKPSMVTLTYHRMMDPTYTCAILTAAGDSII